MVAMAVIIGLGSLYIVTKTRFGKIVRAAAHNASMVSALGIRVNVYFALLFGLGCALAGVASPRAAPVRFLTTGMGLGILVESSLVTVSGGMGSIHGAFLAALFLCMTRSI